MVQNKISKEDSASDQTKKILTSSKALKQVEKKFDPEGSGYDFKTAKEYGIEPDKSGHWQSRVPETGMILKGRKHPTFNKTIEADKKLGYKIIKGTDGRYYSFKKSLAMAEGGATMDKQMEMAFMQDGGLKDEGGTVDPVSGNDVPSGSMQEEVRDDVPAMLSEGEFVFPADVVRYIGLSKLMQMRQQAKMGLKIMEEMGQMGNSEEATLPDDFGIPDIEIIDDDEDEAPEMAQGGVIEAQQGTDVQDMMYRRSENRPTVGAIMYDDGTIDNSAMMDVYNRR